MANGLNLQGGGSNPVASNNSAGLGLTAPTPTVPNIQLPAAQSKGINSDDIGRALIMFSAALKGGGGGIGSLATLGLLGQRQTKLGAGTLQSQGVASAQKAFQSIAESSKELTGDARRTHLAKGAAKLNQLFPQMQWGEGLIALAKEPDTLETVAQWAHLSPSVQTAIAGDRSGKVLGQLMKSPEFNKRVMNEVEIAVLPKINRKVKAVVSFLPQLVPAETAQIVREDGTMSESEFAGINSYIANHPDEKFRKLALDTQEMRIARKNATTAFGQAGIMTVEKEQEVLKSKATPTLKPGMIRDAKAGGKKVRTLGYDPENTIWPNAKRDDNGFAILGEGVGGSDVNISAPGFTKFVTRVTPEGEEEQGILRTGKGGQLDQAEFSTEFKKPEPPKDPIDKMIDEAIVEEFGEKAGPKQGDTISTIPEDVRAKFEADPNMKGNSLEGLDERGYRVVNPEGELIGHLPLQ